MSRNKTMDASRDGLTQVITAPVIMKNFVLKNGKVSAKKEAYLQRSVQDYYIKFCESRVSKESLEKYLSAVEGPIKSLTLEVEFREGLWDNCGAEEVQSRIGRYVVIHRIIDSSP